MATTLFVSALSAVTLVVWLLVMVLLRGRRQVTSRRPVDFRLLRVLIVVAATFATVPSFLSVREGRPESFNVLVAAPLTGRAAQVVLLLAVALLVAGATAAVHYGRLREQGEAGRLVLALSPWTFMSLTAVATGAAISPQAAIYPLTMFAIWAARPPLRVFATLGWVVLVVAGWSVVLGYYTAYGTTKAANFVDKALIGDSILAGPFTHPNQLGTFLALGLPSVLLIRSGWARWLGGILVTFAVGWSGSRTSVAVVVTLLLLLVLSRLVTSAAARKLAATTFLIAVSSVVVALPLLFNQSYRFSQRGRVWIGSMSRWEAQPWFGFGPDAYRQQGSFANDLGELAFHGHNMFVDALVVGGVTMALVVTALLVAAGRVAVQRLSDEQTVPFLFVAAFLIVGTLEVATNFWLPSPPGLTTWILLGAVLFARSTRSVALAGEGAPEGRVIAERVPGGVSPDSETERLASSHGSGRR